jgi:hypothetical protein
MKRQFGQPAVSPKKSTRKSERQAGMSRRSYSKDAKNPYKMYGDDTDRRVEFDEWFLGKENLMVWVCQMMR